METLLIQTIKEAQKAQTMIAIRTDENETDKFSAGFVIGLTDDYMWLKSVSPEGRYDGFILIMLQSIYEVTVKDLYLENLQKLYGKQQQTEYEEIIKPLLTGNDINEYLQLSKDNKTLLTIQTVYNYSLTGYIKAVDEDFYIIDTLNEYAKTDGQTCSKIEDIFALNVDTEYERKITTLI